MPLTSVENRFTSADSDRIAQLCLLLRVSGHPAQVAHLPKYELGQSDTHASGCIKRFEPAGTIWLRLRYLSQGTNMPKPDS